MIKLKVQLNSSYDDDNSEWKYVKSKMVEDSDGFVTDYTWYTNGSEHIFIFGDSDIYTPEYGDIDWETDDYDTAKEWFDNYEGFGGVDDIDDFD